MVVVVRFGVVILLSAICITLLTFRLQRVCQITVPNRIISHKRRGRKRCAFYQNASDVVHRCRSCVVEAIYYGSTEFEARKLCGLQRMEIILA